MQGDERGMLSTARHRSEVDSRYVWTQQFPNPHIFTLVLNVFRLFLHPTLLHNSNRQRNVAIHTQTCRTVGSAVVLSPTSKRSNSTNGTHPCIPGSIASYAIPSSARQKRSNSTKKTHLCTTRRSPARVATSISAAIKR